MRFIVVVECRTLCGKPEGDITLSMIAQCLTPHNVMILHTRGMSRSQAELTARLKQTNTWCHIHTLHTDWHMMHSTGEMAVHMDS